MQHTTRTKFLAAVAAGAITCGDAIATATASNADPSSPSSSSTSATASSTSSSTSITSAPSEAHVTVTPVLRVGVHGLGMAGFQIDGVIYAGADPVEYTSSDIYLDGKLIHSGDGAVDAPDFRLRPIHSLFIPQKTVPVSPGKHTVKVHVLYPTGPGENDVRQVTVSKAITVGPADNPSSTPTTQPPSSSDRGTPTDSGEPPTPSPKTTQLGVTG